MGLSTVVHECDFCVVGGGLAGMAAAIAAARGGTKVVILQDRPMFGGNASSEVRMWVCGADGGDNRETGIIEEIQLESLYYNPDKNYAVWDGLLWNKIKSEKNITPLLNCSVCAADCADGEDGRRIVSVTGWQTTTQTWHRVKAALFADCSGDSILAPLTGAEYRMGREARDEFGEKTSQEVADSQTMGMSCLIQCRKTDRKSTFLAPPWAKKLTPDLIRLRRPNMTSTAENFWYLELGGNRDSIGDTEEVRDELVALAYGMFDYVKNSGEVEDGDYWQLDFLGFLPGKRESRRMVGDYIMTQGDVLSGGRFDDVIAFGGWPLDDHHPDGFYHAGNPNVWGSTPVPYGIPYRCVYSKNISNLFFAGRNISLTHAAMSSARVMATCATLGEAVGTAANLARETGLSPRGVGREKIGELQARLMEQGCFLPYLRRSIPDFVREAALLRAQDENLRNGADRVNRTYGGGEEGVFVPLGERAGYRFRKPVRVRNIHIAFDSDLPRASLPGDSCEQRHTMRANVFEDGCGKSPTMTMPKTLVRAYRVEGVTADGERVTILREENNLRQCVNIPCGAAFTELALIPESLWGGEGYGEGDAHVLSFDAR
ncbi:MAG: FAD-dependent oxidoreductase [Clostridia bacterium]|nr:FAD-dependent oxidoreductase [Clostridia bacterium]